MPAPEQDDRPFPQTTEAFSRIRIDARLKDVGWTLDDGISVHFEYTLSDDTKADYVHCDRKKFTKENHGIIMVEATR